MPLREIPVHEFSGTVYPGVSGKIGRGDPQETVAVEVFIVADADVLDGGVVVFFIVGKRFSVKRSVGPDTDGPASPEDVVVCQYAVYFLQLLVGVRLSPWNECDGMGFGYIADGYAVYPAWIQAVQITVGDGDVPYRMVCPVPETARTTPAC